MYGGGKGVPVERSLPEREFFLGPPQDWSQPPGACKPGVSVILRTRDRPEFLRRAIASVNAQTFRDIGLCVVNDGGAASETEAIVRGGLAGDIAVEIIHNPEPLMQPAACNLGFTKVDREFFCVHDDDDSWSEGFLETMVGYLRQPGGARFIGAACDADVIGELLVDGRIVALGRRPHTRLKPVISLFDSLDFFSHPPPISLLMRSRALELVSRNNAAMQVMYDCEWLARVLLSADVAGVPNVLAFYHLRERKTLDDAAARNSIFEFDDEFLRLRILIENELLRTDVSTGRLGLGLAMSLAFRAKERNRHGLSGDGVRFIERKAKAYFRRKALRRRVKGALFRLMGRKPDS
ncbi:MAG: glycosyltransferase family 2 protein [Bradyrhizobium sp.]|nr:MAG: glycosyltransferase family 2 protein [Bradyrhizobium sp.]